MADGNNGTDRGSAFPTFLERDPYPASSDGRPKSVDSNTTSEFEARSNRNSTVPSTTGPAGEPGLPPSRTTSNAANDQNFNPRSSVRQSTGPPPASRRGLGTYSRDGSRPGSAIGQTHVPSLTNPGFFRPMSPQMLQAQRGQATSPPSSTGVTAQPLQQQARTRVVEETEEEEARRYSMASVNTERDTKVSMPRDGEIPPLPASRGFSITSDSADGYGLPSTAGPGSVMSKNSAAPLNARQIRDQDTYATNGAPPSPMSPRSLRASLGLGSKQGSKHGSKHSSLRNIHDRKPLKSHERLHSNPQSPVQPADEKVPPLSTRPRIGKAEGKNYEYYAGNMLFFLSGRFVNTRAKPLNAVTFILTVLPAALFFGFSAPWLWHNVSPALPIIFAYIFYLSISAFLHAAFSDPGILPRNLHPHPPNPDEDLDPLTVGPADTEWVIVKTFPSSRKRSPQSNAENGQGQGTTTAMEVPTKYCKSCKIWRPPRAHHCRVCDGCIETQDHHCVWLNNCVGRRNYRYFFAYVGFATVMALMLLSCSLVHVGYYGRQNGLTFGESLSGRTQERVAFAMFIYSVFALPYPGCLFGYHLFLVGRSETTREYLNSHKFLPKDRHRPFSQQSLFKNWLAVLGRPRSPSYMGFRRKYVEGDLRMGHTRRREDRIQDAKLEAARRGERVEGLKKRFSVPTGEKKGDGAVAAAKAEEHNGGVEMKQLPPLPKEWDGKGDDLTGVSLGNGSAAR